jgi:hypothetical protein
MQALICDCWWTEPASNFSEGRERKLFFDYFESGRKQKRWTSRTLYIHHQATLIRYSEVKIWHWQRARGGYLSFRRRIYTYIHTYIYIFIHLIVCLTTGTKPLPKRALHIVRFRASSFKWQYPLLSLMSSSSFLRLLPRLPVTSIPPFYLSFNNPL